MGEFEKLLQLKEEAEKKNKPVSSTIDKENEFEVLSEKEQQRKWREQHYPVKEYIITEEQLRVTQNQNWKLFSNFNYAGDKWYSFSTRIQEQLLETWGLSREFVEQTVAGKRKPQNL